MPTWNERGIGRLNEVDAEVAGDIGAHWPSHLGSRSPPRQIVQVGPAVRLQAGLKGCEFATFQNDIYSAARGRDKVKIDAFGATILTFNVVDCA